MQKEKKSKKNNIYKLHEVLDNSSYKVSDNKDEKDFASLKRRLKKTSNEDKIHKSASQNADDEINSLEPKVTIYPRKVMKIIEFPELKEEKTILEKEETKPLPTPIIKEEIKKDKFEDEDIFEIKKVEVTGPEFLKVEPKEIIKEEEEKIEIFEEKNALEEEEIAEWEPVDIVEKKDEEIQEVKIEEEKYKKEEKLEEYKEITVIFCNKCGEKLRYNVNFCPECGNKIELDYEEPKEDESVPAFIPIEKIDEKEKQIIEEKEFPIIKEEPETITLPKTEDKKLLQEPDLERESKIEVFKDINSINDETAVSLYDNGFTTLDSLTLASLKDLTKIKGIKRKQAKKIQKEIKQKSEWQPVLFDEKDEIEIKEEKDVNDQLIEEELLKELAEDRFETIDNNVKIEAFKDMESIDDKTAILLYDNGYTTINSLKEADLKNLIKIKGIKRKQIKKIQKEIDKKIEESAKIKSIETGETAEGEVTEEQIQEKDEIPEKDIELPSTVELSIKKSEWSPKIEEEEKLQILKEPDLEKDTKIEVFKDINSINDETAVLLYDNGFTTLDSLTLASLRELTKIKGIKRKQAKKIQKEIKQKSEFQPEDFSKEDKDFFKEEKDINERIIEEAETKKDEAGKIDEKIVSYEPVESIKEEKFESEDIEDLSLFESEDDIFKNIKSIDEKISKLLKQNGINTIEALESMTIKDLKKIRGIKSKTAKQIKKEVKKFIKKSVDVSREEIVDDKLFESEENLFIKEIEEEWDSFDEDKISEKEIDEIKGFRYGEYTLFEKEIETKSGKKRIVRFFSKAEPEDAVAIELPDNYEVEENKKTGVPYLKRKK